MFTRNSLISAGLMLAAAAMPVLAQLDPKDTMHITFPENSPVTVLAADWGGSTATPRGGAMVLDLHASLTLRNSGPQRIRAVTLQVLAQEVTPGGKGSTTVCSLNVGSGEVFPLRVDLRLLRPLQAGAGPLVEIGLDGVLFSDLTFFGPNKLNSRRSMTAWEMEARRDREYFKRVLAEGGRDQLREEMVASIARAGDRAQSDLQLSRLGRATASQPERTAPIAFLEIPGAPVEVRAGSGRLAGDEVRAPRLELRNNSGHNIRYVELGWAVRDRNAGSASAGVVPTEVHLAPGATAEVTPGGGAGLRISHQNGRKVDIDSVYTFVNAVEYDDGRMWIPSREAISSHGGWSHLVAPSPEEQRLAELYRSKGLQALVDELRKF